jgi:8-oxo-dGTP pyrophosphatase MutT (NUDIX family)
MSTLQPTSFPESLLSDALQHVRAYVASDAHEARHQGELLALLQGTALPFSRMQYEPGHITASGIVLGPGRQIALVFHKKLQLWLQPGGHIETTDATLEAAVRREVAEELGLDNLSLWQGSSTPFDLDVHVIPAFPGAPTHQHFDVRLLFEVNELVTLKSRENLETGWFSLDAVASFPDVSLARVVRKLSSGT